jgi:hypothetical protein
MMAAEVAEGADSGPEEGKSSLKRPPERRREAAMKKRASSRGAARGGEGAITGVPGLSIV